MQDPDKLYAAIEAGGTKFVIAIGNINNIQLKTSIPTRDPDSTWKDVIKFLKQAYADTPFSAISLASFGPLEVNKHSISYGHMGNTPKEDWQGRDMLAPLRQFNLPIYLDTDVNASALGEAILAKEPKLKTVAYVTVGTGIGVGIVVNGRILAGNSHLELGHIPIPQNIQEDPFPGICPFHKNCLEGLASGKAIHARWGVNLNELAQDHPAYDLQASYLGYLCSTLMLAYAPDKIFLGGGVMQSDYLVQRTRDCCTSYLNGYPKARNLETIIERPTYEGQSALLGGFIMAGQPERETERG